MPSREKLGFGANKVGLRFKFLRYEFIARHSTPSGDVGRGTGVQRNDLKNLTGRLSEFESELDHEVTTAELTSVPFAVEIH
jgi:hypothetical protein